MPAERHFFIQQGQVTEIKAKMLNTRRLELPKLKSTWGLLVSLYTETINRKPSHPVIVDFQRIAFDEQGVSNLNTELRERKLRSAIASMSDKAPPPSDPELPTKSELTTLKVYLTKHYPLILKSNGWFFENRIQSMKVKYKKELALHKKKLSTVSD